MQLTELREGMHVIDLRGEDLGKIERYVIDPSTRDVTHVVIEKGVFFPDERVAPVSSLSPADSEDALRLDDSVGTDELPQFQERHYVELGPEMSPVEGPHAASAWAYPMAPTAGFPAYPMIGTPAQTETRLNVPEGSIVLSEGTEVFADDEQSVGKIKEVGTDETGQLAYIVVDPGWFTDERVIPAHWIQTVDESGVQLAITRETLQRHDRDRT